MAIKRYSIYLDSEEPEDQVLVAFLDRFVNSRRTGEALRRALEQHLANPAALVQSVRRPEPMVQPALLTMPSMAAPTTTAARPDSAKKIRGAFFK
jgi:hypothetical protein